MGKAAAHSIEADGLSHNLLGQRLGRKGRDTRERIIAAADRLLAGSPGQPFSLSGVAREASLGMTTLYLYFGDLTELVLAVLEPIMASAETAYVARLREHWPDDRVEAECRAFVDAFRGFWDRHSRILHLRNSYIATLDPRLNQHRIQGAVSLIQLLIGQMGGPAGDSWTTMENGVATALLTGLERVVTLVTDPDFHAIVIGEQAIVVDNMLAGQAHLLALAIHDARARRAKEAGVQAA